MDREWIALSTTNHAAKAQDDRRQYYPLCLLAIWSVLDASHTLAVYSKLPVTIRRPSVEKATEKIWMPCSLKDNSSFPPTASQTLAVLSSLPVTMDRTR